MAKHHKNWKHLGAFFRGTYHGSEVVGIFYSSDSQHPDCGALCASIAFKSGGSNEVSGEDIVVRKVIV